MRVPGSSRARLEVNNCPAHPRWLRPLKLAGDGGLSREIIGGSVDRLHVGFACNIHIRTPVRCFERAKRDGHLRNAARPDRCLMLMCGCLGMCRSKVGRGRVAAQARNCRNGSKADIPLMAGMGGKRTVLAV